MGTVVLRPAATHDFRHERAPTVRQPLALRDRPAPADERSRREALSKVPAFFHETAPEPPSREQIQAVPVRAWPIVALAHRRLPTSSPGGGRTGPRRIPRSRKPWLLRRLG